MAFVTSFNCRQATQVQRSMMGLEKGDVIKITLGKVKYYNFYVK